MNKKYLTATLALLVSVLAHGNALAEDSFRPILTAGWMYGGDNWQVAQTASGAPVQITGGGQLELGVGALWQSAAYPLAASLLLNYQYDSSAGVENSASFRRVPLEGMLYYTGLEKLRFGVGLSNVFAPTVNVTVDGQQQSIKMNNAIGKAFEVGYPLTPKLWANLRLTATSYHPKNTGAAQSQEVSSLALNLSYLF